MVWRGGGLLFRAILGRWDTTSLAKALTEEHEAADSCRRQQRGQNLAKSSPQAAPIVAVQRPKAGIYEGGDDEESYACQSLQELKYEHNQVEA